MIGCRNAASRFLGSVTPVNSGRIFKNVLVVRCLRRFRYHLPVLAAMAELF